VPVDLPAAISTFVRFGRELFAVLRSEGESISKLDLHILLAQLHILQLEANCLKRQLQFREQRQAWDSDEEIDTPVANLSATPANGTNLHVGDLLQATCDHYPARSGAIGRIISFEGLPEQWYVVVKWEEPLKNFTRETNSDLTPLDLKYFELVLSTC